jgi:thioredoxin-like negative regulator of GroEL
VFAPALREEADSHARLGIVEESVRNDVHQLEQFYGTALLHGDLPTALRMLRAAVEHVPSLLSARLALARLLAATGAPGAREVLAAARNCEPYRERVERLLANADRTKEEPPCLTPPLPR